VTDRGTILLVEDERSIAELVTLYLTREGFRVVERRTAAEALAALEAHRPLLVILDVGLPDLDGFEVCRRIRATSPVPVIMLTARDEEVDRVRGLELGADDYVTKPFSPAELAARVRAVLRRAAGLGPPEHVDVGRLHLDLAARTARAGEVPVELTAREFDLCAFLAARAGRALSRAQILDGVWGTNWYGDARTVDVHVAQLRRKLGDAVRISTVRGVGYRLEPPSAGPGG
jgi:DNA-binding response OmpR family regulator